MWIHPSVITSTATTFDDFRLENAADFDTLIGETGSGRIAELSAFSELRGIKLRFWSHPDLRDLLTLPNRDRLLRSLTFYSCIVLDTAPLARCQGLRRVHFQYSQTHDLRPFADLPKLSMLTVKGCALDEHSFRVLLPQLRAAGVTYDQSGELQEREWLLMQKTRARGLTVCIFENAYGEMMVRAPGEKSSLMTYTRCEPEHVDPILEALAVVDDWTFYAASETWAKLSEYCADHTRALDDDRVSNDAYAERVRRLRAHVQEGYDRLEASLTPVWRRRFFERFPVVERG